jgi:hypothetical protein
MTSRERVLTALKLGKPDKVPFIDVPDIEIEKAVVGLEQYDRTDMAYAFGMDAITYEGFFPPIYAKKNFTGGKEYLIEGLIRDEDDLAMVKLPNPDDEAFYEDAKKFIGKYKGSGYALCARTRLGASAVLNSMGLDSFSYNLADGTGVVEKLLDMYTRWSAKVIEHINELGFDFIWCFDDIAYKTGLMFSPQVFREVFLQRMKLPADACKLPWIFHSDGNLMPVIDDLLTLGMNGLHPIEPGAMDIENVKIKYGKQVCIVGNIDLHYTLTRGTADEVEQEVKDRIEKIGKGGGYIISSSNSITSYCKVENVRAMINSIKKYR